MASNSVIPPVELQNLANELSQALDKAPARTELANDRHWVSQEWDDSSINQHARYSLERADSCVMGASALAALIHRFDIGAADVKNSDPEDETQLVYPTVTPSQMDGLWLALKELLNSAELSLQHIRCHRGVSHG